jgi:ABC-type glycerol-3-phosphate transport system substrate-binding protein
MRMRRVLALLPISLVLAACGGGGGGAPANGGTTTGQNQMPTETGQTTTTAPGY